MTTHTFKAGALIHDLRVEVRPISQLKHCTNNARTHSKKQIRQIAESIKVFGFVNPVLVDKDNNIIAGHGRAKAAKMLSIDKVPTIRLEHFGLAFQKFDDIAPHSSIF